MTLRHVRKENLTWLSHIGKTYLTPVEMWENLFFQPLHMCSWQSKNHIVSRSVRDHRWGCSLSLYWRCQNNIVSRFVRLALLLRAVSLSLSLSLPLYWQSQNTVVSQFVRLALLLRALSLSLSLSLSSDSLRIPLWAGLSDTTVEGAFSLSTESSRELLGDLELSLL
jgi:hypothetical protein